MEQYVLVIGISPEYILHVQHELAAINAVLYSAFDIDDGIRQFSRRPFSLVVADLHTAKRQDFTDLIAGLRRTGTIPILALMDYTDEGVVVAALDTGIDWCQPHTITPRLLAEQIKAVLRRYTDYGRYERLEDDVPIQQGDLYLDPRTRIAYVRGRPVQLRPREFALLNCFMRYPNIVLTAETICERAWGYDDGRDVGKAVYNLRKKIEPDPANPIYILTEYRVGYRFTAHCSETCDEKESKRKVRGK